MAAITTTTALETVATTAVVGASTSTRGEVLGHELGGSGWVELLALHGLTGGR